jgi:small-conductance mechanosensitive channel
MSFDQAWDRLTTLLRSGIGGTEFTPLKLIIVVSATMVLLWVTRRGTRWFVDTVLARRGVDVGLREALGVIARYVIVTLGVLVILQSAGIDLTSLNVLVGAVGVGLGFGLQNITSNFFSGLILLFERPIKIGDRVEIGGVVGEVKEIGALRFQLQVWSTRHLSSAGTLKSDLNFEVWRQLGVAGVVVERPQGAVALGLPLVQPPRA